MADGTDEAAERVGRTVRHQALELVYKKLKKAHKKGRELDPTLDPTMGCATSGEGAGEGVGGWGCRRHQYIYGQTI